MPESKHEKFIRLAESRTNKVLDMLKLLGNCANKANYAYTDDDVKKIFNAIEKELSRTKDRFMGQAKEREKFTLR